MKFLTAVLNFILDLIKALVLFVVISAGIFVVIVGLVSGWLYYKYAHRVKAYPICVYRSQGLDIQKYIEGQNLVAKPGINEVTLSLRYEMILDPIIENVQAVTLPSVLQKPLTFIGRINGLVIGRLLGVPDPRPVACLHPISPREIEIFAGSSWYLWGSARVTKKLLPTRLEMSEFKLYTFRIPEDYLDYLINSEINPVIPLAGKTVAPADIEFGAKTVDIKYKVSDLLVK